MDLSLIEFSTVNREPLFTPEQILGKHLVSLDNDELKAWLVCRIIMNGKLQSLRSIGGLSDKVRALLTQVLPILHGHAEAGSIDPATDEGDLSHMRSCAGLSNLCIQKLTGLLVDDKEKNEKRMN